MPYFRLDAKAYGPTIVPIQHTASIKQFIQLAVGSKCNMWNGLNNYNFTMAVGIVPVTTLLIMQRLNSECLPARTFSVAVYFISAQKKRQFEMFREHFVVVYSYDT